jgi:hypothetical protein
MVWTGAITAVTITGAWYGAGLKTSSEIKQVFPPLPLPRFGEYVLIIS